MAHFENTTLVRRPPHETLSALRDDLPRLAALLDDVTRIETIERQALADGTVHVVNVWHAGASLPAALSRMLGQSALAWTDRAVWHADGTRCQFAIEPHLFKGSTHCTGETVLEPAMGGRGTRIRFSGELKLERIPAAMRLLGSDVGAALERMIADAIAQNLGKLGRALSAGHESTP